MTRASRGDAAERLSAWPARVCGVLLSCAALESIQCANRKDVLSPKEEVEKLLNAGLPFAQKMLAQEGEFHPFGAVMTWHGEIQEVAPYAGSEQPPSLDLIDLLEEGFRKGADSGQYEATAIFVHVRVQPPNETGKTDAVEVMLEHREGYCVNVFLPYSRGHDGAVTYGDLFAAPRKGAVFPKCGEQG